MRVALLQLNSSDDPAVNLPLTVGMIEQAASEGARYVQTPEVTNCVSTSRTRQDQVLAPEDQDQTLAKLRNTAAQLGVWVHIGSIAVKTEDAKGRFANRSFLVAPDGSIAARYDKIHMFDVVISEDEQYRESKGYRPGDRAVLADIEGITFGLTICYDLRFPGLYRDLAQSGAEVLAVPSAFSSVTGAAHWEPLLRARAIECGAYVLASAQTGDHPMSRGKPRRTYGHSLAVSPWGEVLVDGGTAPGIVYAEIDSGAVGKARARIPSLTHDRPFIRPA